MKQVGAHLLSIGGGIECPQVLAQGVLPDAGDAAEGDEEGLNSKVPG